MPGTKNTQKLIKQKMQIWGYGLGLRRSSFALLHGIAEGDFSQLQLGFRHVPTILGFHPPIGM